MSGRPPTEIWEDALDEGERRLDRASVGLAVTGMLGGVEVMFGVIALVVTTAALGAVVPEGTAHLLGSLTFGLSLVFITVGRSELFTENFLIPVSAVYAGRASTSALARLWVITLAGNLLGLIIMALIFAPHGVLPPDSLKAAGAISDTYTTRPVLAALLSAVAAGALMTLLTWFTAAAESDVTRVFVSLIGGFVLIAPSLNHAVVGFGEIVFGMIAGTATATPGELARTFGLAVVGNLVGGVALVTATRLVQVRAEPGSTSGGTTRGGPGARRAG
jgi:formate/nitrite transporter FocA (FNT family)